MPLAASAAIPSDTTAADMMGWRRNSQGVQPRLGFTAPVYRPWAVQLVYLALPLLLRLRLRSWLPAGICQVRCRQVKTLVDCYHQFQQGQVRLLLAFRHCEVDDPLALAYLFSRAVPQLAKQQGLPLKRPIHSHFMYDRGMPLWAGNWLSWAFARLGGVPVHRGRRLDLKALKTVRSLLLDGDLPLGIAPEGATNGHSEVVSPLELGTAQLAFWCAEDLAKAGRSERMLLLPVGIQYRYPQPDWAALGRLLSQLEADLGLPAAAAESAYYDRLLRLGLQLLTRLEQVYERFFQGRIAPTTPELAALDPETPSALPQANADLALRLEHLLHKALGVGEQFFGLPSSGSLNNRCRRLEEASWSYIYREDIDSIAALPVVERGIADWIAETASLQVRHMRLVESLVAVSGHYVHDCPSFERFAETSLILFDLVERLKGTAVPRRPRLGWREVTVSIGRPVDVSDRYQVSCQTSHQMKQAVLTLTQDLQTALEELIEPRAAIPTAEGGQPN